MCEGIQGRGKRENKNRMTRRPGAKGEIQQSEKEKKGGVLEERLGSKRQ